MLGSLFQHSGRVNVSSVLVCTAVFAHHFCVHWAKADSVWAAATAPPSHGSPTHSGDWVPADLTSHNPPLLRAATGKPGAPYCLRRGLGRVNNGVMGNRPFMFCFTATCIDSRKKRGENKELEGKLMTVLLLSLNNLNKMEDITRGYFVASWTPVIQNKPHHSVGMTTLPNCWNAKGGISFQPSGRAQSQPKLFIKRAGLAIILNNHFKPLLMRNNASLHMNVLSVQTGFIIWNMTSLWRFQTEGEETFQGAKQTV